MYVKAQNNLHDKQYEVAAHGLCKSMLGHARRQRKDDSEKSKSMGVLRIPDPVIAGLA
ncbi:hypothetical protein BELL_1085g00020 [Botrytis elliptica]|uniref:Uncharacterized protein n=1 Tax=Botrytis elliptica TaxID=278938 RepID=A0A4Z1IP33_9HELO|nr:hypothetical protein BELL_1085g00020 [Botrytis elliptica]